MAVFRLSLGPRTPFCDLLLRFPSPSHTRPYISWNSLASLHADRLPATPYCGPARFLADLPSSSSTGASVVL